MIKQLDKLIIAVDKLLAADITSDRARKATIDGLIAFKNLLTEHLVLTVAKDTTGRLKPSNKSKTGGCKTCRYWDIESAKSKGRLNAWRLAPCRYPLPILPASFGITGQKPESTLNEMCANYGQYCPCYEKRVKS